MTGGIGKQRCREPHSLPAPDVQRDHGGYRLVVLHLDAGGTRVQEEGYVRLTPHNLQRMIRDERYKLIAYPKAGVLRLYDIQNDPYELYDLAGETEQEERMGEMLNRLEELGETMDDTLALREYFTRPAGR